MARCVLANSPDSAPQPGPVGFEPSLHVCSGDSWENVRTAQAEVQFLVQRGARCRRGSDKGRLLRPGTHRVLAANTAVAHRSGCEGADGSRSRWRGRELHSHSYLGFSTRPDSDPLGSLEDLSPLVPKGTEYLSGIQPDPAVSEFRLARSHRGLASWPAGG